MNKRIYENLKFHFAFVFDDAIDIRETGPFELTIELSDGRSVMYDDIDKTIRNLPHDSNHMTEEECKQEFGTRLRKLMQRKCLLQSDLSEITGIPQCSISNYMNGKTSPSFYNADKIAKALGCSLEELRYVD